MMKENYENTFHTWNKLAQQYQDAFMDIKLYDDSYDLFCKHLQKPNASILEIGCGPGNITKYLLKIRPDFKIHATDVAPTMIDLAIKNNPSATFEVLDCRAIKHMNKTFDAVVCGFCLPYLAKNDCEKLIHDSSLLLNESGILYLSFIEGDYVTSKLETSSDGQNSIFVYYYNEAFISSLLEQFFTILSLIKIPYTRANGEKSTHLIFIAKKTVK